MKGTEEWKNMGDGIVVMYAKERERFCDKTGK